MTIKTIEATVHKVESKEFTSKFGQLVGHKIHLKQEDGTLVKIEKNTKPSTNLGLEEGTKIRVTYDTQTGKVEKDQMGGPKNLVILDTEGNSVSSTAKVQEQLAGTSEVKQKESTFQTDKLTHNPKATNTFVSNSEGQRKGMLFNNAVQLAIHRGALKGVAATQADVETALIELTEVAQAQEENNLHQPAAAKPAPYVLPEVKTTKKTAPWNS